MQGHNAYRYWEAKKVFRFNAMVSSEPMHLLEPGKEAEGKSRDADVKR